jgi:DHA1 family tetracycline resistance protein-like MFS transporter
MRSPLPFLLVTLFLDAMGIGLVYPVMPDLIEEIGSVGLGNAALWGGLLATAYAVMQFLCAPLLGALSDRYGRRPVLLLSLAIMAVDYVGSALAQSMAVLLVLRIIAGVTAATHATCNAVAADLTPPEQRSQTFGLLGRGLHGRLHPGPRHRRPAGRARPARPVLGRGGHGGPQPPLRLVGAARDRHGRHAPPARMAARQPPGRLPLGRPAPGRPAAPPGAVPDGARLHLLRRDLGLLGQGRLWLVPLRDRPVARRLRIAAVWAQGYGIRLYLRLLGERGTIVLGFACSLLFFVLFAALPSNELGGWLAIILCPLSALGEVILPALQGRISRLAPDDAQGEALGVVASTRSAAQVAGPLVMSGIFAWGASVPGATLWSALPLGSRADDRLPDAVPPLRNSRTRGCDLRASLSAPQTSVVRAGLAA